MDLQLDRCFGRDFECSENLVGAGRKPKRRTEKKCAYMVMGAYMVIRGYYARSGRVSLSYFVGNGFATILLINVSETVTFLNPPMIQTNSHDIEISIYVTDKECFAW